MRSTLRLVHFWWPLVVGWSAALVVRHATGRTWNAAGLAVLLLGIGAAYSLDRLVDAPADGLDDATTTALAVATAGAAAGACALLSALPRPTAALVPVVSAITLCYPILKAIPLAKTVLVPLVWTWCAIALPFADGSWLGWRGVVEPVAVPLFLLFAAGALLCDLKDVEHDRRRGVASLPVVIGARRATWIAAGLALAAGLAAHAEQRTGLALAALGLGLSTLRPELLATDIVGPLVVDLILSVPGFLIAGHLI